MMQDKGKNKISKDDIKESLTKKKDEKKKIQRRKNRFRLRNITRKTNKEGREKTKTRHKEWKI